MPLLKNFTATLKNPRLKAPRLIFVLLFQSITLITFSQNQVVKSSDDKQIEQSLKISAHDGVSPVVESEKNTTKHIYTHSVAPTHWEIWWLPSMALLMVGSLFFLQQARIRTIQKKRRTLEREVHSKTEEVISQRKSIKMQLESIQAFNELQETQQKELSRLSEKADNAERSKNSFLSMISYGVRTPLNGLLGTSSLLTDTSLTTEQREYTETIRNCGDQLLIAVNDIFDFSKIESGEVKLESKEVNLRSCLEEVMDVFAAKAAEEDIDLIYELDTDVPAVVMGDSFRLKQVLINIAGSAIKFTQRVDGIYIGVRLIKSEGDQCVLGFEIRDSSIGIHHDVAMRMFKSFSQVDYSSTDKFGGTGLGLANCENLVRLMGGSISMESNRGKGSAFSFTINTKICTQAGAAFDITGLEGKKVLVVDNHQVTLAILKNQMEQWKIIPTVVESGSAALAVLSKSSDFDLVVTDLKMPGLDGVQLGHAIRKFHPELPIVLLSPKGDEHGKKYSNLFSSSIVKPIKQASLYIHLLKAVRSADKFIVEEQSEKLTMSESFAQQHPVRILIAEDNLINQKLTQRVLSKLGYKSDVVMNGLEVLSAIKEHRYDLIFMDVQMPAMDGLEATIQIRQFEKVQPIIIAMTANVMEGDRDACLNAGMDDYISKPVKLDELMTILKKWSSKAHIKYASKLLAQA
jgi:signal transduction histidine kinase/CheY-like chemotaxis protein